MVILQALLAFIGRSAGKILSAIFGWAVRALFGRTSGAEQTLLTVLVASAAVWPILLIGIAAPRVAAFALAFVPIPKTVPDWIVRDVWIVLALAVPGILGLALAAKAPPGSPPESFLMRVARGYPTTLGIALAFCISFVSVPLLRLASVARGHSDADIPLVTTGAGYAQVAAQVQRVLNARGFDLIPQPPGFWVRAPVTVMRTLAGGALRSFLPAHPAHFHGPQLEVALYPAGLVLRGPPHATVLAHGLVAEALASGDAYQTTDQQAQALEREVHRVWHVLEENPAAHTRSPWLLSRLHDITDRLTTLEASYDDWQNVYRQVLQLARALDGQPQLLAQRQEGIMEHVVRDSTTPARAPIDDARDSTTPSRAPTDDVQQLSTPELLGRIASKVALLVNKEVALARSELTHQLQAELAAIKGLVIAVAAALVAINLVLLSAVFALTAYLPGWLAALGLAAVMLLVAVIAGMVAWRKHIGQPLPLTRQTLTEDLQWAKEELA